MSKEWDQRFILLTPTSWVQRISSTYRGSPTATCRSMSFQALAHHPRSLFGQGELNSIVFEIKIYSEEMISDAGAAQSDDAIKTVGWLTYCAQREATQDEDLDEASVAGHFVLTAPMFEDVWERVKFKLVGHCSVALSVAGLVIDHSPGNGDYWDVVQDKQLPVTAAGISFTHQIISMSDLDTIGR